jgi:MFS family permease
VIAVVAVAYVAGAPLAGRLADRYGLVRVLRLTSLLYGIGLLYGAFPHTLAPLLIGLPVIALAGAIVLTLPQALAFTLAPPGSEGVAAGLQDFSRGVGLVLGPVVVGAMVTATRGVFSSTDGYASMWLVIGAPVLLAAILLKRLETPKTSTTPSSPARAMHLAEGGSGGTSGR